MRAADGGGSISMAAVSPSSAIMSASAVEMSFSTFKWWDLNMKQAINKEVSVHSKVTITLAVHKIMIVDFEQSSLTVLREYFVFCLYLNDFI